MKHIKHISVLGLTLILLLVACSSGKSFGNTEEVIKALDKHNVTGCEKIFFAMVGAKDGVQCDLSVNGIAAYVEITVFDGNAKDACQKNGYCKAASKEMDLIYYSNVSIWVHDPRISKNSVLEDLKD